MPCQYIALTLSPGSLVTCVQRFVHVADIALAFKFYTFKTKVQTSNKKKIHKALTAERSVVQKFQQYLGKVILLLLGK